MVVETINVSLMNGECVALIKLANGQVISINQNENEFVNIVVPYGAAVVTMEHKE